MYHDETTRTPKRLKNAARRAARLAAQGNEREARRLTRSIQIDAAAFNRRTVTESREA